jgi:adenine deaminase
MNLKKNFMIHNNLIRKKGNLIDLEKQSIYPAEVSIEGNRIVEISKIDEKVSHYILPGLIDSHIHIESSLLVPAEFANMAIPHGTIAVVADPHEISNVCGIPGIRYMIENGNQSGLKYFFGAPSCVPATSFETAGASITELEIEKLFEEYPLMHLGEVMNFPAVLNNDRHMLAKLEQAKKYNRKMDGHAPGLSGLLLDKYIQAGISTDHECTTLDEAREKASKGMMVLIREGSAARNFQELYPLLSDFPDKVMFCTDDCHPDYLNLHHINGMIKRGLNLGIDLFILLKAAVINPIHHYSLPVGMLRPNDPADFIIIDSLQSFTAIESFIEGKQVFAKNTLQIEQAKYHIINNFNANKIILDSLNCPAKSNYLRVINVSDGDLYTQQCIVPAKLHEGSAIADIDRDILKLVVVNRYAKQASPMVGFVRNFGLKTGALASSVAHDSHNIIATGTNDEDMMNAINLIIENKGGISACNADVKEILPLPVAGLMSIEPAKKVTENYIWLNKLAKTWGSTLKDPFMSLSFLALLVIPELKLGDQGLFDVDNFRFTSLFVPSNEIKE